MITLNKNARVIWMLLELIKNMSKHTELRRRTPNYVPLGNHEQKNY
jgi:hypothetical protein